MTFVEGELLHILYILITLADIEIVLESVSPHTLRPICDVLLMKLCTPEAIEEPLFLSPRGR